MVHAEMTAREGREGKVVVIATISTKRIAEMSVWSARMPKLGITGYGRTKADAVVCAKEMFADKVQTCRKMGQLQTWLDFTGIDWEWDVFYDGDLPIDDLSDEEDVEYDPIHDWMPPVPNLSWPREIPHNSEKIAA